MIQAEGHWVMGMVDKSNRIPINIKVLPKDGGG